MDKTTKALKKKLTSELNTIRNQLWQIDSDEKERQNAPLVGLCFKYKNNYSIPEKPSDYWYMYSRVTSLNGDGLNVFSFQTDKDGKLTVEPDGYQVQVYGDPCSPDEFNREFKKAISKVESKFKAA